MPRGCLVLVFMSEVMKTLGRHEKGGRKMCSLLAHSFVSIWGSSFTVLSRGIACNEKSVYNVSSVGLTFLCCYATCVRGGYLTFEGLEACLIQSRLQDWRE